VPRYPLDPYLAHVGAWLAAKGASLCVDLGQAQAFLERLDPVARSFSFRSFSDTPYTRGWAGDPLEGAWHGSLAACWPRLVDLNRAGAAVGVTVNATDGRGRALGNIQRVRALFVDADRPAGPFPLAPHISVATSPGHCHHYWLTQGVAIVEFTSLQRQLSERYGTDHKVGALNQSMGLPGLWRRKSSAGAWQTRLLQIRPGPAASREEILALLLGEGPG
jgi:hypothetical protein